MRCGLGSFGFVCKVFNTGNGGGFLRTVLKIEYAFGSNFRNEVTVCRVTMRGAGKKNLDFIG